jgi:alpha-1,2-mannosyltransferase
MSLDTSARITLRRRSVRLLEHAPWLLVGSLAAHAVLLALPVSSSVIDLRIYRDGSPNVLTGQLYDFTFSSAQETGGTALPFTYPPFAALLFLPLSLLPWIMVRWAWQVVCVACLWWLVRSALRLVATGRGEQYDKAWQRRTLLWTAAMAWIEPVRTTMNFGQVNLVLAAVVLAAIADGRHAVGGLATGLAAGIKLTPAVAALYFLATRRFAGAMWSLAAFGLTVGIGFLAAPTQSQRFWFHLLGDAGRIGTVWSVRNQSLRGAVSRMLGGEAGISMYWLAAVLLAVALTGLALRASARSADALAAVVAVEILGLLISPISWSHHWVWVVPTLIWLLHGPARHHRVVLVTTLVWVLAVGSYVISLLSLGEPSSWSAHWYVTVLGATYPACGLLTLAVVAMAPRRSRHGDGHPRLATRAPGLATRAP